MELKKIGIQSGVVRPIVVKPEYVQLFQAAAPNAQIYLGSSVQDIFKQTDDLDMLIAMPDAFNDASVDQLLDAPSLKWVQSWVSGTETVLMSRLTQKSGLRVSGARGIHGTSMSDHIISNIYYFMRQYPLIMKARAEKNWKLGQTAACDEALARTVGVIGLGNIGMVVAKKLHLLGFRVLAAKRRPVESEWVDRCYPISELDEMLPQCDYVVLVLPHTKESEKMFSTHQFEMMKKSAYFINVARGAIVDDDALLKALDDGEIAGAALDAFLPEPLPVEHPYWDHPKVFMSFHQAAISSQVMDRAAQVIAENIRHYQADEPLDHEDVIQ